MPTENGLPRVKIFEYHTGALISNLKVLQIETTGPSGETRVFIRDESPAREDLRSPGDRDIMVALWKSGLTYDQADKVLESMLDARLVIRKLPDA